jgi:hypothetical protein
VRRVLGRDMDPPSLLRRLVTAEKRSTVLWQYALGTAAESEAQPPKS